MASIKPGNPAPIITTDDSVNDKMAKINYPVLTISKRIGNGTFTKTSIFGGNLTLRTLFKRLFLFPVAAMCVLFGTLSCGGETEEDNQPQGRITYEISYPYNDGKSILASLLPTEMVMTYKGSKMKVSVDVKKIFSNVIISDEEERSLTMLVQMSSRKMACEMNEEQVDRFVSEFPEVSYLKSNKTRDFDGVQAKQTTAVFADASKEVQVFYNDEVQIENVNWCTPFKSLQGILLQYEINKYGLTMRFTAKKIENVSISDSEFAVPMGYEKYPLAEIEKELITLFSQVQDNM
jgi:hypothetical protein